MAFVWAPRCTIVCRPSPSVSVQAFFRRGKALAELGKFAEAVDDLRQARSLATRTGEGKIIQRELEATKYLKSQLGRHQVTQVGGNPHRNTRLVGTAQPCNLFTTPTATTCEAKLCGGVGQQWRWLRQQWR